MGEVVFIGDVHRQWHHVVRGLARLERKPAVAVLLGDMECDRPLDEAAAPLLDAGLGGTFRRRVWEPPHPRRLHGRAELAADVATLGADWTEAQRAAMADALGAMAIWPEDYDTLAGLRADVLVTHEAPSSHPQGFAMIDGLARAMGARLLVHGHHHVGYRARAEDGLEVQGVGAGWAMGLDGRAWWPGEADRWLGAFPKPWRST